MICRKRSLQCIELETILTVHDRVDTTRSSNTLSPLASRLPSPASSCASSPQLLALPHHSCHEGRVRKACQKDLLIPTEKGLTQPGEDDHEDKICRHFSRNRLNVEGLDGNWSTGKETNDTAETSENQGLDKTFVVVVHGGPPDLLLPGQERSLFYVRTFCQGVKITG